MTRSRDIADIDGLLTTKGDIYAATAAATPARLAAGNNGESLVADSTTASGLRYNASANINLLANGAFDIWQRGTGNFTANQAYTTDRWFIYSSSSHTLTQETSVVPEGATNAVRMSTTAGNSYINLQQCLEQSDVEKLAGKTVTFSVYLRANATYNGSFAIQINWSTTGNSQVPTWINLVNVAHTPSTSAYTRVTATATIPTTAKGLAFMIAQNNLLPSGSIYYAALAKVELGSVATPFVRLGGTYQADLAACQRYYQRIAASNVYGLMGTAIGFNGTTAYGIFYPKVSLRNSLSVEFSNLALVQAAGVLPITALAIQTSYTSDQFTGLVITVASGGTADRPYGIQANNNAAGYLAISGEL